MDFRSRLARSHRPSARRSGCLCSRCREGVTNLPTGRCAAHLSIPSPLWRAVPTRPWSAAIPACSSKHCIRSTGRARLGHVSRPCSPTRGAPIHAQSVEMKSHRSHCKSAVIKYKYPLNIIHNSEFWEGRARRQRGRALFFCTVCAGPARVERAPPGNGGDACPGPPRHLATSPAPSAVRRRNVTCPDDTAPPSQQR